MHERDVEIELCVHPSAQPTMGGGGQWRGQGYARERLPENGLATV